MGSIAFFCSYKLTTSSGKDSEDICYAHIVFLLYKLKTSAKDIDELSIGFDRNRKRRQRELTNNKIVKCKHNHRYMLKDIFGFAEHQKKYIGSWREYSINRKK